MSTTLGRLTNQGDLKISGELNSRNPPVTNGLLAYFPFDGTLRGNLWGKGWSGSATANSAIQDTSYTGVSLVGGSVLKFKGWFKSTGINGTVTFYCYHQVNGVWQWQGVGINNSFKQNEWVYVERSIIVSGTPTDTQSGWGQGISLRQDCTTGTLQWRDCQCSVDAVQTNCSLTDQQGIYIEEPTTNSWNGMSTTSSSDVNWSVINNPFPSTPFPRPSKIVKCTPKSYMNYYTFNNVDGTNYPSGTVFTMSAWVFVDKNCDCTSSIYICGEGKTNGSCQYDKTKLGTWQYLKFTVTSTDVGFYFLLYANTGTGNYTWTKGNVYYACIQVEKRAYNTLYTPTSKNSGNLVINSLALNTLGAHSLVFDYKHPDLSSFSNNMVFASSYDGVTNANWFGLLSRSNTLNPSNTASSPNVWNRAIFVYDGTNTYIYINGSNVYTFSGKLFFVNNLLSFSSMTGWNTGTYLASHQIKNVAIYSKALSTNEIYKLNKNKFSLTSVGNLIGADLKESAIGVPTDAYYYPLDFEAEDNTKMFSASEANNLVTDENNSLWVGNSLTNLLNKSYQNLNLWTPRYGFNISYYNGENKCSLNTSAGWEQLSLPISGLTSGATYTFSFKFNNISNFTGYCRCQILSASPSDNTNNSIEISGVNATSSISNGYNNYSVTFTAITTNIYIDFNFGYVDDSQSIVFSIKDMQLEAKPFKSSYTLTNRAASSLEFNFNSSIGLDWSKDWSIVYFKKPVGTHTDDLIGYNIESLGCNSNSVGGAYIWLGKGGSTNSIQTWCTGLGGTVTIGSITPNTYFNNWHMISLQKTGTTITVKQFSTDGVISTTVPTTSSSSNYYLTQYGYDFKMGGWDNGNPVNTYYRDLIVVKGRCMSDTEVQNIWKRKMSQKDYLYLQGQLIENVIL